MTFYSYKGGTGRTMALANVSWILAMAGKRVLALDWDLESPGLHRFFQPFIDQSALAVTDGVVELLSRYSWAATEQHENALDWHMEFAKILDYAVSLEWDFPGEGTLDFVSAGRQNRDYSSLITSMDWDNFYGRLGGGQFFDALREDMKRHYDYVLIDSRTGLSDIAEICTVQFPDVLVDCFTLSDQSIDGASAVARHIDQRYGRRRKIRILPVPMRIEFGENAKVEAGRALARARFDRFPKGLDHEEANRYWLSVEIPYRPFYAFEETLATFGDAPGSPNSMLAAFERLAAEITEGQVSAISPMDEQLRLATLERFTRRGPAESSEALIVHAAEDRPWADWVSGVLSSAGFRVTANCTDVASPEELDVRLERSSHTIVLLSPAFIESERGRRTWESLAPTQPGAAFQQVTVLRILNAKLEPFFSQLTPLDLTGLGEEQAADAVLRALGRPSRTAEPVSEHGRLTARFPGAARTSPAVWNVDRRNAVFTGRGQVLEQLRDQLLGATQRVVLPQALHGLAGVGKTQVALEYAHRFRADYDVVWWVPALQPDSIRSALAAMAGRLGLRVGDNVAEAANAALEALRRGTPYARWLLIFDNAPNQTELKQFLPGGDGHVLITSLDPAWTKLAKPIAVDVFTEREAALHLLRRVPGLAPENAVKIGRALGFLPLAIEQVAAWLEATSMPASEYLNALEHETASTLDLRTKEFPQSVALTWNVSFRQLREASPAAARLLELLAFFSSEPISLDLIYSDQTAEILVPYDETLRDKLVLGKVVREISRFALAKVDQGNNSIQVHTLVQAVMREGMDPERANETMHDVHKILVGARPPHGDTDDPDNWPSLDKIMPHVEASLAAECDEEDTRQMFIDLVRYQWKRGNFEGALASGQYLADLWRDRLGADYWQRLFLLSQLANVYRSQGLFTEAYKLDMDVWDRQKKSPAIGPTHPHTLITASGLTADMRALGMFKNALRLDEETYAALKDLYGEDHPRTLMTANNLAVSHRSVGNYYSARKLDEDTLERRQTALGEKHPYTLFSAANLARDLREGGQYEESVTRLRATYETYLEVLGDQLPDPLRTAKSLAVSLRKAGHTEEALKLAEGTYDRYRQFYPDSPDAVAADAEVAVCLWAIGDGVAARDRTRRTLGVLRDALGEDHHYGRLLENNLAIFLREVGDVGGAYELAKSTVPRLLTTFGEEHPFTLAGMLNLANCAADLDRYADAAELEGDAIAKLTDRLYPTHPDTLAARCNLSASLEALGRTTEARAHRQEAIALMSRLLGEDHPDVVAVRRGRRLCRDLEPQPA
ncbi:FxSxx-COOH system tetratricopeptide repeat protein [Actinoallomurus iriomotensis]|uniref:ATP/GTP-binding protein n=1 Tax=Actinoallomurus iriomotensis TaxID=478107 RepID=A0A9W6RUX4_9ACTN|nr:FxSxx-COOH system tetratricopeptide repeat protein [Actinoallomurus iriomotensis]GLY80350.1 hypothetical protein Airi01_086170 [Actinoallomurus iriomotensis]